MSTTELLMIRHGESQGNVGCSDEPDCPLTLIGAEQARRLGLRLAKYDLSRFSALTSPYQRAARTAALIAEATGLSFEMEERVREWGKLAKIQGKKYLAETPQELVARMTEFLEVYKGRKIVVVSHASPIAVLTQLARGKIPVTEGPFWTGVGNCCLRWLRATSPIP